MSRSTSTTKRPLARHEAPRLVLRGKVHVRRNVDPDAVLAWAIAQRIREARERAGLRQADLAGRAGLARPNVARLEAGRHLPSLSTLRRVAEALGVALPALLEPVRPGVAPEDRRLAEAGRDEWACALDAEDSRA